MDAFWAWFWGAGWFWFAMFWMALLVNGRAAFKLLLDWKGMLTTCRLVDDAYATLDTLPDEAALEHEPAAPVFVHLVPAWQEPGIATTLRCGWTSLAAIAPGTEIPIAAKPLLMITVFGSYAWYSRATQILWAPTSLTTMSRGPSARRRSAMAFCGLIGHSSSSSNARRSSSSAVRRSWWTSVSWVAWRSLAVRPPTPDGMTAASRRRTDPSMSPMSSTSGW